MAKTKISPVVNDINSIQVGKNFQKIGVAPAIALTNPKYSHNVGAAMRSASCYGIKQLWYTGDRVSLDSSKGNRLPREERMKGYQDVELRQYDYFFDLFEDDVVPVAVEIRSDSELLPTFEHPEKALYVFGPEDGSIDSTLLRHCHRFVVIPTRHCLNLATAVSTVLYDRHAKRQAAGLEPIKSAHEILNETRGFIEPDYESL